MSQLEQIYAHAKAVEEHLASLLEQEKQKKANETRKPTMYVFVYEQTYTDIEGWGPNNQIIEAYDIEEAFCTFGHVVKVMNLTVRNIRYGLWSEMQEELDAISAYWSDRRKKH